MNLKEHNSAPNKAYIAKNHVIPNEKENKSAPVNVCYVSNIVQICVYTYLFNPYKLSTISSPIWYQEVR